MILSGMLVSVWILNTYKESEQELFMNDWKDKLNINSKSPNAITIRSENQTIKETTNQEILKPNN